MDTNPERYNFYTKKIKKKMCYLNPTKYMA